MPLIDALKAGIDLVNTSNKGLYEAAKGRYAPTSLKSEAASKLAYANLMGPQFIAKLMGNTDVVANSPQLQNPETIKRLYQAGMGGASGGGMPQGGLAANPFSSPPPMQGNNGSFNPAPRMPPQGMGSVPQQSQGAPSSMPAPQGDQGMPEQPQPDQGPSMPPAQVPAGRPSYAENVANYSGVVEEGKEAGKIRAKDIDALNTSAYNATTNQDTFDALGQIVASPEFEQIRQTPLLGHHELAYYAKEGTPKQQQMVGQFYTLVGNIIKDSSRDFAGQFRRGEQQLLQSMKPNDADTVDTARGKLEMLTYLNRMLKERATLSSQMMNQHHMNKGQALELADKQINGVQIRQQIHDRLNPTITIRSKKSGEIKTIPVSEARKMGINVNG